MKLISLDNNCSTTQLISQKEPQVYEEPKDKFQSILFFPSHPDRKGEGGLRKKGYFKYSYEIENNKWYACNFRGERLFEVEPPNDFLFDLNNFKTKDGIISLPLVSVITVVLNGEKYLEKTICSVINQTYPNIEYIIVDGGSTDNTVNIIKKYENYIDYWISEPDSGVFNAMNKGIILSMGKIIGIINSDDWYELETITQIVRSYIYYKVDIIHGDMIAYGNKGPLFKIQPHSDIRLLKKEMILNHSTCFVAMSLYKRIGLFDENFKVASDYEFLLRALKNKAKFFYIPRVLANMRCGGISDKGALKAYMEAREISIKHGYSKILAQLVFIKKALFYFIKKIVGNDSKIAQFYRKISRRKDVL